MSGSQHNPNGRQAQLGSSWSPLQLQMANLLARAPQAHMASERGVTWHTPTPPPHLYHVPQPSPPDPLQAMKGAGNSVFRHTATPPELYRHTPTPPDKHLLRHTPSPGDVKAGAALPPVDLYGHMGSGREKLNRPADLGYARGVDLSVSRAANGASLSVRDAPTINSLIARAPRHHRVDELLERLAPAPVSPHSVIVTARAAPTPSPPSSNEDSADSTGAPKRKRKPERTIRVPSLPLPLAMPRSPPRPVENGSSPAQNGPETRAPEPPSEPPVRRKTRSGSAETIDDIAAMIASTDQKVEEPAPKEPEKPAEPVTIDKLKSVLASDEPKEDPPKSPPPQPLPQPQPQPQTQPQQVEEIEKPSPTPEPIVEAAAAPRRRAARARDATNVPVESPSEGKPAEPEPAQPGPRDNSFVEVENQLEKMFAGIEEPVVSQEGDQPVEKEKPQTTKARKRRKSAPTKGERKAARRASRTSTVDDKKKRKVAGKKNKEMPKDAYDSGSNASSGRSRGPYIQIRGPRDSPLSVSVMNAGAGAGAGEEEGEAPARRPDFRNGLRARGLHCSTLGLRYDATTPDATWLCAFCERGPHAAGLGDLFGPYPLETDCPEYSALDEATRRKYEAGGAAWLHEACAVWAPGLLAAGARLWGLASAVWSARGTACGWCARGGAALACAARACPARAHVPCARQHAWQLQDDDFRATCPRHPDPS